MLEIDRTSNTSVHDQLLEQLRYQIASGRYKVTERLPSTRRLAEQLDVSFHTVRKVYQSLEEEGLLEARVGSGYVVKERTPLREAERMERGARVVHELLQRLIGLGLDESEVEYLMQEQMSLLKATEATRKLVFVAPFHEMAERCAEQIERHVQRSVEPVALAHIQRHLDADYVFAPFDTYQEVSRHVPRADVVGVATYLTPDALSRIARLLDDDALGLITRHADAIAPLMKEIRRISRFGGQIIAASVDQGTAHVRQVVDDTDLLVYTPSCRRALLSYLGTAQPHVQLDVAVTPESIEAIRESVPGR